MQSSTGVPASSVPFLATVGPAVTPRQRHYLELDALRGLAAFIVVLSHFSRLWEPSTLNPSTRFLLEQVTLPLLNGSASVTLFFLLSGFVLTLPYKRGSHPSYSVFLRRRIARIYLPYLAALLLALLGDWLFHTPMQVSAWFSQTWTAPLTPSLVLQHLFLIGNYDTAQVNTAFWSLAVEMRLSMLFPLICIPLLRWSRSLTLAVAALLIPLSIGVIALSHTRLDTVSRVNLTEMLYGTQAFVAGILLARWLQPIQGVWNRFSVPQRVAVFICSFILWEWSGDLGQGHLWVFVNAFTMAGASGVLITALCSRQAGSLLNHAICTWLGRISYSLYLIHATVLFILAHLLLGPFSRIQLLLPYLVLALCAAALFFRTVEKPSIHLSRSIGRKAASI